MPIAAPGVFPFLLKVCDLSPFAKNFFSSFLSLIKVRETLVRIPLSKIIHKAKNLANPPKRNISARNIGKLKAAGRTMRLRINSPYFIFTSVTRPCFRAKARHSGKTLFITCASALEYEYFPHRDQNGGLSATLAHRS